MPTAHVSAENMAVGKKNSGKHWTRAEVDARQAAADAAKRKTRVVLTMPDWLSADAQTIWKKVRRQAAGLEILDNLDAEMLAIYCDALAKYKVISQQIEFGATDENGQPLPQEDLIKSAQAWARLAAGYAEKLGFTPAARARLAKKKADDLLKVNPFDEAFGA